jgi:dipeptidyl aminopeptidase/acylaminoacyl peptidase
MVMSSDGTNVQKLEGVTHVPRLFPPSWSPDSRILAILSSPENSPYLDPWKSNVFKNANIYLVDVETGIEWPLLEDSSMSNLYPTWSPDGSQIAFLSNFSGNSEIWVVNVDGSNLRQLTSAGKDVRFPYWRK